MSQATARVPEPIPPDFIPESMLVSSDGVPVDNPWQRQQINLAIDLVHQAMAERGRDDYYTGGDMFVYYSTEQARAVAEEVRRQMPLFKVPDIGPPAQPGKKAFRGPDVFVVMGDVAPRKRKVWASWLEGGRLPDFILELQSESTAEVDAGEKKDLYAQVFKTREYFRYGPDDPDLGRYRDVLVGSRLGASGTYETIAPDERGLVWSEVLGLYVGRWDGFYGDGENRWIRLYDAHGRLVPTPAEAAEKRAEAERWQKEAAEKRAEAERRQKEAAEKRAEAAEREAARLRKLLESRD